jgi:hypothetical protein
VAPINKIKIKNKDGLEVFVNEREVEIYCNDGWKIVNENEESRMESADELDAEEKEGDKIEPAESVDENDIIEPAESVDENDIIEPAESVEEVK